MIPPRHHPPETLLLEYATGALREAQALSLATHLAYCPACRWQAERLDELIGCLPADWQGDVRRVRTHLISLLRALDELERELQESVA